MFIECLLRLESIPSGPTYRRLYERHGQVTKILGYTGYNSNYTTVTNVTRVTTYINYITSGNREGEEVQTQYVN